MSKSKNECDLSIARNKPTTVHDDDEMCGDVEGGRERTKVMLREDSNEVYEVWESLEYYEGGREKLH